MSLVPQNENADRNGERSEGPEEKRRGKGGLSASSARLNTVSAWRSEAEPPLQLALRGGLGRFKRRVGRRPNQQQPALAVRNPEHLPIDAGAFAAAAGISEQQRAGMICI